MIASSPKVSVAHCKKMQDMEDESLRRYIIGSSISKKELEELGYINIDEILYKKELEKNI